MTETSGKVTGWAAQSEDAATARLLHCAIKLFRNKSSGVCITGSEGGDRHFRYAER